MTTWTAAIRRFAESLASVGEGKSELFLSMVCLSLMARYERADDVLTLIDHVQAQCAAEAEAGGAA